MSCVLRNDTNVIFENNRRDNSSVKLREAEESEEFDLMPLEDPVDSSTEEDSSPTIVDIVDGHVTLFLNMIKDPTNEIFFYYFKKEDKEVFKLTKRVLLKFFSTREDRDCFTQPFRLTFCYLRNPDLFG